MSAVKKYTVKLSSCGNPDHGQYAPVSPREVKECDTIEECQTAVREYIVKYDLGGGNWSGGLVYQGRKKVGRISYNGRFWPEEGGAT